VHIATNCDSEIKITFVDGGFIEAPDSDSEDFTYHPNLDESDGSSSDFEFNCIWPAPSNYIYLSSGVHSHNIKRRTIGEELISFTYSLRLGEELESNSG